MNSTALSPISQIADDIIGGLKYCNELLRFTKLQGTEKGKIRNHLIIQLHRQLQNDGIVDWLFFNVYENCVPSRLKKYLVDNIDNFPPPQSRDPRDFIQSWLTLRGIQTVDTLPKPRRIHRELMVSANTAQLRESNGPTRVVFEQITRIYDLTRRILRYLCWYYQWSLEDRPQRLALFSEETGDETAIAGKLEQSSIAELVSVLDRLLGCRANPFATPSPSELTFSVFDSESQQAAGQLHVVYEELRKNNCQETEQLSFEQLVQSFYDHLRVLLEQWRNHRPFGGSPPQFLPRGCRVTEVMLREGANSAIAISEESNVSYNLVSVPPISSGAMLLLPVTGSKDQRIDLVCERLQSLPDGELWCDPKDFESVRSDPEFPVETSKQSAILVMALKSNEYFDLLVKCEAAEFAESKMARKIIPFKSLVACLENTPENLYDDQDRNEVRPFNSIGQVPWVLIQKLDEFINRVGSGFQARLYMRREGKTKEMPSVVDANLARLIVTWSFKRAIDSKVWEAQCRVKTSLTKLVSKLRNAVRSHGWSVPENHAGLYSMGIDVRCYLIRPDSWPLSTEDIEACDL